MSDEKLREGLHLAYSLACLTMPLVLLLDGGALRFAIVVLILGNLIYENITYYMNRARQ